MDLAIGTAPKDVTGSCRTCKKQFEEGDLRVCMNPAFDLREINRLSSKTPVPKANNIIRTFVHLDCLDFYAIKAFQCMFHETIGKLEEEDTVRTFKSISLHFSVLLRALLRIGKTNTQKCENSRNN
jgi:hypothetical protein